MNTFGFKISRFPYTIQCYGDGLPNVNLIFFSRTRKGMGIRAYQPTIFGQLSRCRMAATAAARILPIVP